MRITPNTTSVSKTSASLEKHWLIILGLCGLLLIAFRMHSYSSPLETDECNYIIVASQMLDGARLYVDVWDHQPPGVFVLFMGAISLLGDSQEVFRWLATGFSLVSLVLIANIGRRLFGRPAGILAALLWAILSSDPGTSGWGCNREIYMNTFVLASLWHLVLARTHGRKALWHILFAGFWLGMASVFKTVIAAYWLALVPVVWLNRPRLQAMRLSRFKLTLLFGFGPMIVWMFTIVAIGSERLPLFIDAVFRYNIGYSGMDSGIASRFASFFTRTHILIPILPLLIGAVSSVVLLWHSSRRHVRRLIILLAFLAGSYVAVCLPGRFWSHYYYLLLPPLVLVSCACMKIRFSRRWYGYTLTGLVIASQLWFYLSVPTRFVGMYHPYHHRQMLWARDQGLKINSLTRPEDTIFAWDSAGAGLYYYSQRPCCSRFTMIGSLLTDTPSQLAEDIPRAIQQRRGILLNELKEKRPRIILISEPPFQALLDFLKEEKYVQCGAEIDPEGKLKTVVLTPYEDPIEPVDWGWQPQLTP